MVGGSVEPEVMLGGGRLTPGVVRVGGTVRRPVSPASRLTVMLLAHLASEGFWRERAAAGQPGHAGPTAAEVLAWTRQEAAHFASHRSVFAGAPSSVRDSS